MTLRAPTAAVLMPCIAAAAALCCRVVGCRADGLVGAAPRLVSAVLGAGGARGGAGGRPDAPGGRYDHARLAGAGLPTATLAPADPSGHGPGRGSGHVPDAAHGARSAGRCRCASGGGCRRAPPWFGVPTPRQRHRRPSPRPPFDRRSPRVVTGPKLRRHLHSLGRGPAGSGVVSVRSAGGGQGGVALSAVRTAGNVWLRAAFLRLHRSLQFRRRPGYPAPRHHSSLRTGPDRAVAALAGVAGARRTPRARRPRRLVPCAGHPAPTRPRQTTARHPLPTPVLDGSRGLRRGCMVILPVGTPHIGDPAAHALPHIPYTLLDPAHLADVVNFALLAALSAFVALAAA